MRTLSSLGFVLVLGTAAVSLVTAQGRGDGGRGGAGRAGGPPVARQGTVERITVHGKSLEGNLEVDSPDRAVTIYLPPSYAADQARRFPVVYLLHGYGGKEQVVQIPPRDAAEGAGETPKAQ